MKYPIAGVVVILALATTNTLFFACWREAEADLIAAKEQLLNKEVEIEKLKPLASPLGKLPMQITPECLKRRANGKCRKWAKI